MTRYSTDNLISNPIEHYPFATVACFDATMGDLPRRRLDVGTNAAFLNNLSNAGAPAVLIGASTGHGHLRTPEELGAWFKASSEADIGNMVMMALLRPEDGIEKNREFISLLSESGYQVIFFRPGTDLAADASDEIVVESIQPLVECTAQHGLAVGLYSIPDVSGISLTADAAATLRSRAGGENIVAIKVTEADFDNSTKQFLRHPELGELKIVQGWDTHMATAITVGGERCGVTSGPMSFAVFQYLHIFDAVKRRDWKEMQIAQAAVTQLFQSMQDDPTKFADLQRAKYIMGLGHPLTGRVETSQVTRVFEALDAIARTEDQQRLSRSLDLMEGGPFHDQLKFRHRLI